MKIVKTFVGVLFFTFLFMQSSFAQVEGSAHDFTDGVGRNNDAWFPDVVNLPGNRLCAACHVPHNAKAISNSPLWSHEPSAAASYPYYTSQTITANATYGLDDQIGLESKLCLSCHDGTISLDNFEPINGNGPHMDGTWGAVFLGTDLSDDHPVGFTYNDALATLDGDLEFPSSATSNILGGTTISEDLLFGPSKDQLECATCHDPHDTLRIPGMLRVSMSNSELCITCHDM